MPLFPDKQPGDNVLFAVLLFVVLAATMLILLAVLSTIT